MAEIICKETSCAFNQEQECSKKTIVLERGKMLPTSVVNCLNYEPRHEEAAS